MRNWKKVQNTNINEVVEKGKKARISEFVERLKGSEDKIKKYSLQTRKLNKESMQDTLGNRIFYVVLWKPLPKPIKRKVIELMRYFRKRNPKDFIID